MGDITPRRSRVGGSDDCRCNPCIQVQILKLGGNWVQHKVGGVTSLSNASFIFTPRKPFAPLLISTMPKFLRAHEPAVCAEMESHINRIHFIVAWQVFFQEQSRACLSNCEKPQALGYREANWLEMNALK